MKNELERPRHPSGRPFHHRPTKGLPIMRIVPLEPATPRLRTQGLAPLIGFHHIAPSSRDGNE